VKIKMKVDISGSRNGQPWPARGETVEVPDGEGADLCAAGMAEPVSSRKSTVEKAVPNDDSEKREDDGAKTPLTTESAPAVAKKTTPAKKAAPAKKTAPATPQADSK
jgi:hypothetical protein